MSLHAADTGGDAKKVVDLHVSGFLPGPEITGNHRVKQCWVSDGAAWRRVYQTGGVPPSALYVTGTPTGGDAVEFLANWTSQPGMVLSDYEVGAWYDWSAGYRVLSAPGNNRVITPYSTPGQIHQVSFTVRAKGDPSWGTDPSAYAESAIFWWKDPRDET